MDVVAFLFGLEFLDGVEFFARCRTRAIGLGVTLDGLVDSAVRPAADEADNVVLLVNSCFRSVAVAWLSTLKTISKAIEGDVTSLLVLLGHGKASHEARHCDGQLEGRVLGLHSLHPDAGEQTQS